MADTRIVAYVDSDEPDNALAADDDAILSAAPVHDEPPRPSYQALQEREIREAVPARPRSPESPSFSERRVPKQANGQ